MACTLSKALLKALLRPLNWLRNSLALIVLVSILFGIGSCYKDTRTCQCARQPRFNLKDDCHPAEQFVDEWAEIQFAAAIRYHPGTERFMPEYNPSNANEVAFILKVRTPEDTTDPAIKPMLIVANLLDGSHRFLYELPFKHHDVPIAWGRNGNIILNSLVGPSYFINASNGSVADSFVFRLKRANWNYQSNLVAGWWEAPDTRQWSLGVLQWPTLEFLETKFESFPLPTTSSIAWSQENEIALRQIDEVGAINFETEHYSTIFRSEAEIEIGLQGDVGSKTDYAWAPTNNDLYFVNNTGIFKVSKGDDKQYRIKKNCPNRQYEQISVSPNGDKIIAQRRDIATERDGRYISENIKLVIMDMNGCNEEILFEDWDGLVSGKP